MRLVKVGTDLWLDPSSVARVTKVEGQPLQKSSGTAVRCRIDTHSVAVYSDWSCTRVADVINRRTWRRRLST